MLLTLSILREVGLRFVLPALATVVVCVPKRTHTFMLFRRMRPRAAGR